MSGNAAEGGSAIWVNSLIRHDAFYGQAAATLDSFLARSYQLHRRGAMIHHVSIPARDPQHVAEVLAELMGGKCHPFGPLEGAFMATSGDGHGR